MSTEHQASNGTGDEEPPAWVDVGVESDFDVGTGTKVRVGEAPVAVFRTADRAFVALADQCPHAGAPLSAGALRDGQVVCSWHGWAFDAASGRCISVPSADAVPTHAVKVADGHVLVSFRAREPGPAPGSAGQA